MTWRTSLSKEEMVGVGLYTPKEAAAYAHGIRPQQLIRWIHGTQREKPVITPVFPEHREVITFIDMVQSMAIRDMVNAGISFPRIRSAVHWIQQRHPEIKFPFIHNHHTYLIETTKDLAILLPHDDEDHVLQVSGKQAGQYVHAKMLDRYLKKLEFNESGVASRYIPHKQHGRRIVLNPAVRLGQPIIEPCGLLVEAVVDAVKTEGGIEQAAWMYEVDEVDVQIALSFWNNVQVNLYAKAS
jgi:uncharacterized protein (DUF433 family)